ncbi:5-formyltetrahydrofolate cyclo-ligase [Candidatus Aenigmatarchaeota archaeon]
MDMKNENRKETLTKMKEHDAKEIIKKSDFIRKKFLSSPDFRSAKNIMVYISKENEVNTHEMIKEILLTDKKIIVPFMSEKCMLISELNDFDKLKENKYGFLEPENLKNFDKNNIDLIVVPGICFDVNGRRIGRGAGHYDKFLSNINDKNRIAFAFDFQVKDRVTTEKHDINVFKIITEKRTIDCKK